jgi:hypothetical protein
MIYLIENGKSVVWVNKPDMDYTWNDIDISRAKTYEMRLMRLGMKEEERKMLVEVIVMKKKHSGLIYSDEIEEKIKELILE